MPPLITTSTQVSHKLDLRGLGQDNNTIMETLLRVTGSANNPQDFNFNALASLPDQVPDTSKLVAGREGSSVRLAALLRVVEPKEDAHFITLESTGGDFSASIAIDAIVDQSLILYRLGNAPLPINKGGPFRFLVIDPSACTLDEIDACANVKHLGRIDLSPYQGRDMRPTSVNEHAQHHENELHGGGVA